MEATKTITLKLLIDTKAKKVFFAEATKEFVDFLFFSLSLPVGTITSLLEGKSMGGSIGNLCNSFANLIKEHYVQPDIQKDILLNPNPSFSSAIFALLPATPSPGISTIPETVYSCNGYYCKEAVTDKIRGSECPKCKAVMNKEVKYIACTATASLSGDKQVFTYMISDDLIVTPMSTISSISMMKKKFKITDLNLLQEKEVEVGNEEGLELLKAFFQSLTVFTDVLLGWEKDKAAKRLKVID